MNSAKKRISKLLAEAFIQVDGDKPWDITVHNERFYERVLQDGSLALGETYMDGWWDAERLDIYCYRLLKARLDQRTQTGIKNFLSHLKAVIKNPQKLSNAFEIGEAHYDIGNDLYQAMLDKQMVYTCGYWNQQVTSLDEAQYNKLTAVCNALKLKKGQRILDIGCGWGSFAAFVAKKYGVDVVGITVSEQQATFARKRCRNLPVEIRLQDYRQIDEKFDHIVSLGMFEHVGYKNYRTYMQTVNRCLKEDGIFVLHTIGGNKTVRRTDPWIDKYIFPNSMIPSIQQIGRAIEELFIMEDWSNHGPDYDKTLMAWYHNFCDNWEILKSKYTTRFKRMWSFYLLSSAASFRVQKNQQWQMILTKPDFNKK